MTPEQIRASVEADIRRHRPQSTYECCRIAARVLISIDNGPWTPFYILKVAAAGAEGLFGESWFKGDYGRKSLFIDIMEMAIVDELAARSRNP